MIRRLTDEEMLAELAERSAEEQHAFREKLFLPIHKADRIPIRDRAICELADLNPQTSVNRIANRLLNIITNYQANQWVYERSYFVYPSWRPKEFRLAWQILTYGDEHICDTTIRTVLRVRIRQNQHVKLPGKASQH